MNIIFTVFDTFCSELRRISTPQLERMLTIANNINPLFIKFKMKYGYNLYNVKNDFLIQFQRYDSDKCPGYIQVSLLQKIMEFNEIKFELQD